MTMALLSRREFLKSGASAAVGTLVFTGLGRKLSAADLPAPDESPLSQFGYGEVRLLEGPMLEQFNRNHAFFLKLDEDSLLKPFRQRAGIAAPGEDMGGWYSFSDDFDPGINMTGFIPGHSFGQYLSGLARAHAVTGSTATREKVQRLVSGFGAAVSTAFYRDYPLPAYTFDKIVCGLIDAHEFAGASDALGVLDRATDAALPWLPERALTRPEMSARPHRNMAYTWDESYTLPENLFLANARGAGGRYRDLAVRFLQDGAYFDPLSEGRNVLPGEHAYSHVNELCSACQAYLSEGSRKHLRAAKFGFQCVRATQSFATGGWGPDEAFVKPGSGALGESLARTHHSFETPCGAYGHFKVARYLLRITGDSRYGDSMERVLYNSILGAKPIKEDGSSFYYSDYNNSASKFYHQDKWPCCSGTFPQITADYGISSYFRDAQGVFVNLFVPSRVSWVQNGAACALTQRTSYPLVPETSLELEMDRPAAFSISLRVPEWAGAGTRVAVNGRAPPGALEPGTFHRIARTWVPGDRIEYSLGAPLRLEAVDDRHPRMIALTAGPLALFAIGDSPIGASRAQMLAASQVSRGSSDWSMEGAGGRTTFRTFEAITDEKYRLYHEVAG
jgi:DUF1680 family protein